MDITRRSFSAALLAVSLAGPGTAVAAAPGGSRAAALEAIRAYAEAHRRFFTLPALTVGVTTPQGFSTTISSGFADLQSREPVAPSTLFQIGSISKVMTAALLHQLAAEGKFGLDDDVGTLLPDVAWPAEERVTLQNLLDHVSGLPGGAPAMPSAGRLWLGYKPGEHWHYSNLGYDAAGRIAERFGEKPLGRLLEERLFKPLGMVDSRGAIRGSERLRYAQGYEPFDQNRPYFRGMALRPAAWVEVSSGSGSVGSTGSDMIRFMRGLADAAQGRGGLGLSPEQARAFTSHFVPSSRPGMSYGNGLMKVADEGRTYLHHTGGMVSFSSSFHLDPESGIGAFASTPIHYGAEYRPRSLTLFAVKALAAAEAGRPIPAPPPLEAPVADAQRLAGRYTGLSRSFEVRAGPQLMLVASGREAPLQAWGEDMFRTSHPDFSQWAIKFDRAGGSIVAASWGPETLLREGSGGSRTASDPALARLAGRFVSDSPWAGVIPIVERGGKLWIGTDVPMARMSERLWRVGKEEWSPDRAEFTDYIDGRPQTLLLSGERFERRDL